MPLDNEAIGLLAGSLTTLSFLPQVIRVWSRRSADDISLSMFVCFCLGVALWVVYGALVGSLAIVAANVVTFMLAGAILIAKLRFRASRRSSGDRRTGYG